MSDRRSTAAQHPLAFFASRSTSIEPAASPIDATPDLDPGRARTQRRLAAIVRGWLQMPAHSEAVDSRTASGRAARP